jgi:outer membrane protein
MTVPHIRLTALLALATASLAHPVLAQSSDQNEGHIIIGGGAAYRPEYKGSNDYEVQPFPYLNLRYPLGGMAVTLEGADLKLDVLGNDRIAFGPIISYQQGRDDDISNPVVRRLPTIDGAVEGGAFFEMQWPVGPGEFKAGVKALADLSGVNEGYSVGLNAGYRAPITSRLSLGVGAGMTWADEKYMGTYYGVDAPGAIASGLPGYTPEAGLEKVGVNVSLTYRMTERWGVALFGGYDRLLDGAADSPIVTLEGSPDQYTGGLALFYKF